jgi:hypothetical protein
VRPKELYSLVRQVSDLTWGLPLTTENVKSALLRGRSETRRQEDTRRGHPDDGSVARQDVRSVELLNGPEFWDITPRSVVEIRRRFGGEYCLQLQAKQATDTQQAQLVAFLTSTLERREWLALCAGRINPRGDGLPCPLDVRLGGAQNRPALVSRMELQPIAHGPWPVPVPIGLSQLLRSCLACEELGRWQLVKYCTNIIMGALKKTVKILIR